MRPKNALEPLAFQNSPRLAQKKIRTTSQEMKSNPNAPEIYTDKRSTHWDEVALRFQRGSPGGRAYHRRLRVIYRNLVPPGQRVLELGCGAGDLLAACEPAHGVGVDFSRNMLREAAQRYPGLEFIHSDVLKFEPSTAFDVVILSDLINDLWDVQGALETAARAMGPRSRLILNFYSRVWEPALQVAAQLGLAQPMLPQNWLSRDEIRGLLSLAGLEEIRSWREILLPLPIPGLQTLANKYLVRFWPLNHLAVTNFSQVRPLPNAPHEKLKRKVSVIVPVRNEAGNIPAILKRVPEMGAGTEIVFVEGHSTDGSFEVLEEEIRKHSARNCVLLRQPGVGKGDAVRHGFAHASGEAFIILDADLTVSPEDLVSFL